MLTLATVTLPAMSVASSSRNGAIIRTGRTTPPRIDEHRPARAEHLGVEIAVGDGDRLHMRLLQLTADEIRGAEIAPSRQVPRKRLGADRHQARAVGPQQGAADFRARDRCGRARPDRSPAVRSRSREPPLFAGGGAQGLVIDDQHPILGDDQAVDLSRTAWPPIRPTRGTSAASRGRTVPQNRDLHDRQGLAPDLVLFAPGKAVRRQRQKAPRCAVALRDRQFRQALQQPVHQQPALETVAPTRRKRGQVGGAAPLGRDGASGFGGSGSGSGGCVTQLGSGPVAWNGGASRSRAGAATCSPISRRP